MVPDAGICAGAVVVGTGIDMSLFGVFAVAAGLSDGTIREDKEQKHQK